MAPAYEAVTDALDVIRAIEPAVQENLGLLVPVDRAWQPTDYLPDLGAENWREQVEGFRTSAMAISDELLVVLVGDMVTEEALPAMRSRSTAWCAITKGPAPRRGHDGCEAGPLRKTGTVTC